MIFILSHTLEENLWAPLLEEKKALLEKYMALLLEANRQIRLVGPWEEETLWKKHILDCIPTLSLLPPRGKVVDLGSGAGLPGMIWAICRPDLEVVLCESIRKKAAFLERTASLLELSSCRIVAERSEELARREPADVFRAYCDYVGRLNAVLKPARPVRRALLYYPIHDLWEEYRPVAGPLRVDAQSARAQKIVGSFNRLGQSLQRGQIPFCLVDHRYLAAAAVEPGGKLKLGEQAFEALVVPAGAALPEPAAKVVARFRNQGGRVIVDGEEGKFPSREQLQNALSPTCRATPASDHLALGEFTRDGRRIFLISNVGTDAYKGHLTMTPDACVKRDSPVFVDTKIGTAPAWILLDPATGKLRAASQDSAGRVELALEKYQAVLMVENAACFPLGKTNSSLHRKGGRSRQAARPLGH